MFTFDLARVFFQFELCHRNCSLLELTIIKVLSREDCAELDLALIVSFSYFALWSLCKNSFSSCLPTTTTPASQNFYRLDTCVVLIVRGRTSRRVKPPALSSSLRPSRMRSSPRPFALSDDFFSLRLAFFLGRDHCLSCCCHYSTSSCTLSRASIWAA